MSDQRRNKVKIMREWAPHRDARANGAPHARGNVSATPRMSEGRTVEGRPGHSRLQDSMPDKEALVCEPPKRKKINWTPNACLNSTSHRTLLNIRGLQKDEDFSFGSAPAKDEHRQRTCGWCWLPRRCWLSRRFPWWTIGTSRNTYSVS